MEAKYEGAEEKIKDLQRMVDNLEQRCYHLNYDNVSLTQQVTILSSQNHLNAIMIQQRQQQNSVSVQTIEHVEHKMNPDYEAEEENTSSFGSEEQEISSDSQQATQSDRSDGSQNKTPEPKEERKTDENNNGTQKSSKRTLSTIAMKLKLSLQKNPDQEPSFLPKKFLPPRLKKSNMVRSVMIGGLFKGLTREDIIDHFEKFGTVIDYTEPVKSYSQNDGTKFVFLKFDKCDAVERVVGEFAAKMSLYIFYFLQCSSENAQHTINGINIIAKKSYKDL